jgi:replicative DNA helicase
MLGGGIAQGEMAVVGARPSHGKTMFGLQWSYHVARTGHPCLVISEEMTAALLAQRATMTATAIHEDDWQLRADEVFEDVSMFFRNRRPILAAENCRTAERAAQAIAEARTHHGIRLAVVDYVQLLRGSGNSRYEQVSDVSMTLKAAAVENNVALVVLGQLNRECEKRPEFQPKLQDLKDSGQIEQDADVVLFLIWPWKYDTKNHPSKFQVLGAKNRNRGIRGSGAVELVFDAARQMVTDPKSESIAPRNRCDENQQPNIFPGWQNEPNYQEFPR